MHCRCGVRMDTAWCDTHACNAASATEVAVTVHRLRQHQHEAELTEHVCTVQCYGHDCAVHSASEYILICAELSEASSAVRAGPDATSRVASCRTVPPTPAYATRQCRTPSIRASCSKLSKQSQPRAMTLLGHMRVSRFRAKCSPLPPAAAPAARCTY
jgi:hypothetical protein